MMMMRLFAITCVLALLHPSVSLLPAATTTTTATARYPVLNSPAFSTSAINDPQLFKPYPVIQPESARWAIQQNLDNKHALTHSLFREVASHLRSCTAPNGSRAACLPFLMKRDAAGNRGGGVPIVEFTCNDLEHAIASDYLDACTGRSSAAVDDGEINNGNEGEGGEEGWRMEGLVSSMDATKTTATTATSTHNTSEQHSFQSKRLQWTSVLNAENTVVFNSAGAYISSQLAPTSLAALHGLNGAATGVCLNLYVTKSNILQSAPPHTDKQDVVVVQTQGRKRWRVYSPPDSSVKLNSDPFCRGKGKDALSVPMLSEEGSELLLDVMLVPGDILFVPARFPHTTDTLDCYQENHSTSSGGDVGGDGDRKSSIHLTLGLDTHVWAMNYMSMRTLALRRFGVHDVLEGYDSKSDPDRNMDNCVGKVNELSYDLREGLFSSLDGTSSSSSCDGETLVLEPHGACAMMVAKNLLVFHDRANFECGWIDTKMNNDSLTLDQCLETVTHFRDIGQKIKASHENMYIAALDEERRRDVEGGGWAMNVGDIMEPQRADRLSIFRVPIFFEQLDKLREDLRVWGDHRGDQIMHRDVSSHTSWTSLPMILDGDQVEANILDIGAVGNVYDAGLKSTWSSAKIVKVRSDGLFNLQLFDGTVEEGVYRHNIKGPHGLGVFI